MKKNILFLIESLCDGGSEKAITNIATEISKYHNVILVVADNKKNDYSFEGTTLVIDEFISKKPLKRLLGIRKLRKIKKTYDINLSISFLTAYNLYNVLSKYKDKTYISIRNHLSAKKEGLVPYWASIYSNIRADKIICCAKSIESDQIKYFKADIKKTVVIENFTNIKSNNNSVVNNTVITIGRLTKHKGQEHIIEAIRIIKNKLPNVELLILGRGPNEEYLHSIIKSNNLEKEIQIIGYKRNVEYYLNKSKLFILASDYEGFSNSILEAMTCSLPVIATNSPGGNSEILNNKEYVSSEKVIQGKYGILIPSFINKHSKDEIAKNEIILANEILNILENKKKYMYYKTQSRKRASYYNKEKIIKKWLKIIEEA